MTNGGRRSSSTQRALRSDSLPRPEAKRLTRQLTRISFCAISVALVMAAQPAWVNKPIPLWSAEDAKQILTDSPGLQWCQRVYSRTEPGATPARRSDGWGQGHPAQGGT